MVCLLTDLVHQKAYSIHNAETQKRQAGTPSLVLGDITLKPAVLATHTTMTL